MTVVFRRRFGMTACAVIASGLLACGGGPASPTGTATAGDAGNNVFALRTSDGATLWHASIGNVGNGPITYELDGQQYMVVAGGGVLYAWTLPEKLVTPPAPAR